jgi:two-component system chemotaxis response regulator CheY
VKPVHALVIDDSRAMRAILGQILRQIGFDVSDAGNGRVALEELQRQGWFDLALVDWNMPEMNGFDFVRAVRTDRAYDDMRLVMVTTEAEHAQMLRALEAGADEYVTRPFTRETIVEKLELMGMIRR